MYAKAYSNNDVALILWHYDQKIDNCLGFCIERVNVADGSVHILPAWVGFEGQENKDWQEKDTSIWPIQKYNWKDLTAQRDQTYKYRIIPMTGTPDSLKRTGDAKFILETNEVSISEGKGKIKAFFNRGILSTQALSHKLKPGAGANPSLTDLKKQINEPGNKIRLDLTGELKDAVLTLINKAMTEGGKCYCALYELTDEELIQNLIRAKDQVELILTNADGSEKDKTTGKTIKVQDMTNADTRTRLRNEQMIVYDRFVPTGHIGHNKFVVYENKNGVKQFVLSGSTNWTATGLCAQSNNAIIIESEETAGYYYDFWLRLKDDTLNNKSKQGAEMRTEDAKPYSANIETAVAEYWFSPNTKSKSKPKIDKNVDINDDPRTPPDLKEVFELMDSAKKSILFLVFQPGFPSIIDKALEIQRKNKSIFIRGAATDVKAVADYNTELYHGDSSQPDLYDVVAASNIKDDFAYWEKELLSAGHAIIHDKIVVIDGFTDHCVVLTGSHNLGYKASYENDENLLIIKGNKELANAYGAHVMDVYEHYRWRYTLLNKGKDANGNLNAYRGLKPNDSWQDKYFVQVNVVKPEIVNVPRKDTTFWTP